MCPCVHWADSAEVATEQACAFPLQLREKCALMSVEMVKASEKDLIFSVWKPLFLGMCQFCFLSAAFWETITFAFILFFLCHCLFLFLI